MLDKSTYLQLDMGTGEAIALRNAAGGELHCIRGEVWLTEENGGRDIGLTAGQSYRLSRPGRTVVEAIDEAKGAQCRLYLQPSPSPLMAWLRHWAASIIEDKKDYRLVLTGRPG